MSRHIQIVRDQTPYFQVHYSMGCKSKIAPGMTYTVFITFNPSEVREYFHKIKVVTDDETFFVNIYGKKHNVRRNYVFLIIIFRFR